MEKRLLQAAMAVVAVIPAVAALTGVVRGPSFLGVEHPWPVDLDSHFRLLSMVFLGFVLVWYSCIPQVETKTERLRLLAALAFAGGLARLFSLSIVGLPSRAHVAGIGLELVVVPLLVVWQARVSGFRAAPEAK